MVIELELRLAPPCPKNLDVEALRLDVLVDLESARDHVQEAHTDIEFIAQEGSQELERCFQVTSPQDAQHGSQ